MITVVGGIKGGSGKTTLATNLCVMRSATGKKVLLVDADEQKTASGWNTQRGGMKVDANWTAVQLSGIYLFREVMKMAVNYDDIIIDTGARDNSSQRSALTIADVFVTPFRPNSSDIWTINELKDLVILATAHNPKMKTYAIINQSEHDANGKLDIQDSIEIISECKEITCLPFSIGRRRAFSNANSYGLSVIELESAKKDWVKKAQFEMQQLYDIIYT